jgi:hypothetical protein
MSNELRVMNYELRVVYLVQNIFQDINWLYYKYLRNRNIP